MPGNPIKRSRVRELEEQVAHLTELLGAQKTTEEEWGAYLSQELRDQFAARALIQEWGDAPRALLRLGFDCPKRADNRWVPEVWALANRIFKTPGCQEILGRNFEDLEGQQKAMFARQMQIATTGNDADSVRAATLLAKVMGLNKADQGAAVPIGAQQNIFIQLVAASGEAERHRAESFDSDAVIDATDFLTYEPGEATLIDDSDEPLKIPA